MTELLLVMTSLPDQDAAKALAKRLIDSHLAACVQIQTGVQSIYRLGRAHLRGARGGISGKNYRCAVACDFSLYQAKSPLRCS